MKKTLCLILALVVVLQFAGCGHKHEFSEWTVTTEVTCTADGAQERTCECGEKETEVIASTGHTFKAATAFAPKTCSGCALTEGEPLAKVITVGDIVEAEDHSFTVEKTEFTAKLKEKRGNITYNYGGDGFLLATKLNFTNLATEAFEDWNSDRVSDVKLEYGGKYNYEGEYWCPDDDIVPLASDSMYIVYTIPESMKDDAESSILASFTIDGVTYAMTIQEGKAASESTEDAPEASESDLAAAITIGDVRTDKQNFEFTFKDMSYTNKPSEKQGNTTYTYGQDGHYLVLKLEFTNLGTEAFDDWNSDRTSDMNLKFADKYDYEGKSWCPGDEIVPLATGNLYVVFEVPETVDDSADSLVATFKIDGHEFTVDCRA